MARFDSGLRKLSDTWRMMVGGELAALTESENNPGPLAHSALASLADEQHAGPAAECW